MTRNQELIEEAKKRGYTHNNFKCLNKSYNRTSIESLDRWYYNELEDTLFTNTRMNGGKAVYRNGIWAEIVKPIETFTPIAMICTQEQFEAIKPKLKGLEIEDIKPFTDCKYLVNNLGGESKVISNFMGYAKICFDREVHEEWNEEIFLKACGIKTEPITTICTKEEAEAIKTKSTLNEQLEETYTLENIQVDCSELSEGQIKEMCKVYENNGYKQWIDEDALKIQGNFVYLRIDYVNEFYINGESGTKTTITYEKFMELFDNKETLQEKEQRLLEELAEVRKEIEESKPKVGDWIVNKHHGSVFKNDTINLGINHPNRYKK